MTKTDIDKDKFEILFVCYLLIGYFSMQLSNWLFSDGSFSLVNTNNFPSRLIVFSTTVFFMFFNRSCYGVYFEKIHGDHNAKGIPKLILFFVYIPLFILIVTWFSGVDLDMSINDGNNFKAYMRITIIHIILAKYDFDKFKKLVGKEYSDN